MAPGMLDEDSRCSPVRSTFFYREAGRPQRLDLRLEVRRHDCNVAAEAPTAGAFPTGDQEVYLRTVPGRPGLHPDPPAAKAGRGLDLLESAELPELLRPVEVGGEEIQSDVLDPDCRFSLGFPSIDFHGDEA